MTPFADSDDGGRRDLQPMLNAADVPAQERQSLVAAVVEAINHVVRVDRKLSIGGRVARFSNSQATRVVCTPILATRLEKVDAKDPDSGGSYSPFSAAAVVDW